MPGRIALVGSGEYLPAMQSVEAWLLEGRAPRFVQLATAAAPEGDRSVDYWRRLGHEAAQRLGVEQVFVDVRTAEDADDPALAALVSGAGAIYFSGGNPTYLAQTLAGSAVLRAVTDEWRAGASLAGCSAGAMVIGGYVPNIRHPRSGGTRGFGIVPGVHVLPHFDRYSSWMPGFAAHRLIGDGYTVVGIDEETALIADPDDGDAWLFRPVGMRHAWIVTGDGQERVTELPLRVQATPSLG